MPESPELLMREVLLREFAPPCYVCDAPATLLMISDVLLDGEANFHFCDEHHGPSGTAPSEGSMCPAPKNPARSMLILKIVGFPMYAGGGQMPISS